MAVMVCLEDTTLSHLAFIIVLPPSLHSSLSLRGGTGWRHPTQNGVFQGLSLFTYCPVVGFCVCLYVLQENTSLMMAEQGTDL